MSAPGGSGEVDKARVEAAMSQLRAACETLAAATASMEAEAGGDPVSASDLDSLRDQLAIPVSFGAGRPVAPPHLRASDAPPAHVESTREELVHLRAELQRAIERAQAAETQTTRVTAEYDAALDELRQEHVKVVREQASSSATLPLDELLTVFGTLGRSADRAEVMGHLVRGLAGEFPRVALFVVRGAYMQGVEQIGFDTAGDISKITMPLAGDSLVSRAVTSKRLEFVMPGMQGAEASMPFGGTPASAVAIPLMTRGETFAIVYADDPDAPEFAAAAPQRLKFAELLYQYAQLVLQKLASEQKFSHDLRRLAIRYITEIEQSHARDVATGTNPIERQRELKLQVDHMRAQFLREAGDECQIFDEQLRAIAQDRDQTVFGQDLSLLVGRPTRAAVLTMRR